MKTLLYISVFLFLFQTGFCATAADTAPADGDGSIVENAAAKKEEEPDITFHDVSQAESTAIDSGEEDLEDVLDKEDETDVADAQDIYIKLTRGKNIILTLPDGGGSGGTTYTRWGKWSCPRGAKRVYHGYAGSGHYSQKGNGANFLCLPRNPQYVSTTAPAAPSLLYGTEYESYNRILRGRTHDYNVPCAVCHVPRSAKIILPARVSCPSSWRREYYGYLMTSHVNHPQNLIYECVDAIPDVLPNTQRNTNGALFYFVQAQCSSDGLPCRQFKNKRAVTCAVCTK